MFILRASPSATLIARLFLPFVGLLLPIVVGNVCPLPPIVASRMQSSLLAHAAVAQQLCCSSQSPPSVVVAHGVVGQERALLSHGGVAQVVPSHAPTHHNASYIGAGGIVRELWIVAEGSQWVLSMQMALMVLMLLIMVLMMMMMSFVVHVHLAHVVHPGFVVVAVVEVGVL